MRLLMLLLLVVLTLGVRATVDQPPRARLPRGTYATEGRDPVCLIVSGTCWRVSPA